MTSGVAAQIPVLQEAILRYVSSSFMREGIDYVAVYRIGATEAAQVLEPTPFYNTVRNFFATELATEDGPTALYDSAVNLLTQISGLAPDPALVPSLVIVGDGTTQSAASLRPATLRPRPRAGYPGIPSGCRTPT